MFNNNIKIAWRHLLKNKYTSAINLIGLVVGMTAALFIWQYVAFEKSYDSFHQHNENIVRVRTDRIRNGEVHMQFAAGAACAGPFMKKYFPEVEDYVKLRMSSESVFMAGDVHFREKKGTYATKNFFEIFSFPLIKGDPATCLEEPFSACISESQAKKYFGDTDPMGQTLNRAGQTDYKITGVFADPPENSHLKFNIIMSYSTYKDVFNDGSEELETEIMWDGFYAYLKLRPGTDIKALESKITPQIDKVYGEEMRESNDFVEFALMPLKDIHLTSNYLFEAEPNGDGKAVSFLLIIGSLVLLIAWFNYINLATARSETRAREVGVRKVIGSSRSNLIGQFMFEAGILNLGATVISFALAQALAPVFVAFVGKPIPFSFFSDPILWAGMTAVFVVGTLLAGLYPAFILSKFNPVEALNNNSFRGTGKAGWLRKGLVIGQFATSVILIAGTIVIFKQLSHMQATELGVNIDQTMILKSPAVVDSTYQVKYKAFKNEVKQLASVREISSSTSVPGQAFGWTAGGVRRWGADQIESEGVRALSVEHDFAKMYEMELVEGRYMNEQLASDSNVCILNERAVEQLKFQSPKEAVGVDINFWGDRLTIVGVVKNFHQESPKVAFDPMVMRLHYPQSIPDYYSVKLNTDNYAQAVTDVESRWSAFFPGNPFDYFFLDDHFQKQFEADQKLGSLFGLFSGLAIFVSCLGLFALAAFVAERRTKEIGIRKVLGASVESLVGLLSKEFLLLVGIAILIAVPIAWLVMNNWLQTFEMRTTISWSVFTAAGLAAVMIAFLTVSFQSVKAALANPVESLRSE